MPAYLDPYWANIGVRRRCSSMRNHGPAEQLTPVAAPVPASTLPAAAPPDGGVPTSYGTAAASVVTGGAMERTIQQLSDMGFPRQEVERALQAALNNPDRAVEYLISGIPEGMTHAASAPVVQTTLSSGGTPIHLVPAGGGAGAVPSPAMAGGAGGGGGGGRAASPESLAPLWELRNNPQFVQLEQMVTANPQSLPQMLPALQPAHHDLVRASTHQLTLMQAAGGQTQDPVGALLAAGGQGGAGPMPGGPGGPVVVRLSEEERAAVESLTALGFDSQMATQAYLACDKDEEMAANFLFDNGAATSIFRFGP